MKKLLFSLVLIASLASCKKEYTCQCSAGGIILSNESIGERTKKDAKTICDSKDDGLSGVTCIEMEK